MVGPYKNQGDDCSHEYFSAVAFHCVHSLSLIFLRSALPMLLDIANRLNGPFRSDCSLITWILFKTCSFGLGFDFELLLLYVGFVSVTILWLVGTGKLS